MGRQREEKRIETRTNKAPRGSEARKRRRIIEDKIRSCILPTQTSQKVRLEHLLEAFTNKRFKNVSC